MAVHAGLFLQQDSSALRHRRPPVGPRDRCLRCLRPVEALALAAEFLAPRARVAGQPERPLVSRRRPLPRAADHRARAVGARHPHAPLGVPPDAASNRRPRAAAQGTPPRGPDHRGHSPPPGHPSKPSHWPPSFWRREQGSPANPNGLWYRADGLDPERPITGRGKWVPGIHMPRWASRMTLRVTEVRVQRLQDVTDEDAIAEGILRDPATGSWLGAPGAGVGGATRLYVIPIHAFRDLWESLHGPDA